ncbi:MAG: hypothetical protein SPL50_08970 [Alloprevotella sp.]|nr:hypothetical protein [Alloprevotella sp.]
MQKKIAQSTHCVPKERKKYVLLPQIKTHGQRYDNAFPSTFPTAYGTHDAMFIATSHARMRTEKRD